MKKIENMDGMELREFFTNKLIAYTSDRTAVNGIDFRDEQEEERAREIFAEFLDEWDTAECDDEGETPEQKAVLDAILDNYTGKLILTHTRVIDPRKMTKRQLAEAIERHHLYSPMTNGVYSKNYYRYNSEEEVRLLMKYHTKDELIDLYRGGYAEDGRELSAHETGY